MNTFLRLALASGLVVALAPSALRAQVSAFDWTLQGNPNGSGQVVGETLVVTGDNSGSTWTQGHVTWLETSTPVPLHVSVQCSFDNQDADVDYDGPVFVVEGVHSFGLFGGGFPSGDYWYDFDVQAGQSFGFGVWSLDGLYGPGVATFHHLVVTKFTWNDLGGSIDPRAWFELKAPVDSTIDFEGLCGLGDLDGDGVRELAIGDNEDGVRVVSGASGAKLLEMTGPSGFGEVLADAGDVNADGVPDLVAGMFLADGLVTNGGRVEVRSGLDGALLFGVDGTGVSDYLGLSVAGLGDVDGDGFDDVVAGAGRVPQTFKLGYALVLGGPDGHPLHVLHGSVPGGFFGCALAALDDVDGDGVRDVAVAEPSVAPARVVTFSGASGATLSTAFAPSAATFARLSSAADFDGDGSGDFGWWHPADDPAAITVRAGATGAKLAQWAGTVQPSWAVDVAGADFDGDGLGDIAFTRVDPATSVPSVRVYSGAPGHPLLHELVTASDSPASSGFGGSLSAFGDVDLDGATDLAIGSPVHTEPLQVVHALDGKGLPIINGVGSLAAGSTTILALAHAKPSSPFWLVLGLSELGAPFKGGVMVPQPDLPILAMTNNDGRATFTTTWPSGVPSQLSFWVQAWIPDGDGPQGFTASNGLSGSTP